MHLSFIRDIFQQPWMIEPATASANRAILKGLLVGLKMKESETIAQTTMGPDNSSRIPLGKKINVIDLKGTMFRDDTPCGEPGTRTLSNLLREADAAPAVMGHIIVIDSGGGAANSVSDLADAITECQKPVVAFVDGYMCSAAMYAGSYCDFIIAHREDDRIGCIGTMVQIEDWPKEVRNKDGFVRLRLYAEGSEEKNDEYEAALAGEYALIKERILNPLNKRFVDDIRHNRPNVKDDQLKGRTFNAAETVGTLIDAIGGFDSAIDKVVELSNTTIQKMEGLNNLQSIESCKELVMVDGVASLTQEQLDDIENKLAEGSEVAALREQLATEKNLNEQLTSERDTLKGEVATKQTRIEELEAELEKEPAQDPVATATHNGNPVVDENADAWKEPTDEESMEYCHNVIKGKF